MTRRTAVPVACLALTFVAALGVAVIRGQQAAPAPVFTAAQAAAGRTAYDASCASCHLPDLSGRNEAPQLAGANFVTTWGSRTVRDLVSYIQAGMPPGNAT
ncbi:MAG: c-type cytochrome, partial [Panacagrimonas sp.]